MKVLLNGFCGKMGQTIYNLTKTMQDVVVTEGVDRPEAVAEYPNCEVKLYDNINDSENCDVVIDFSHPNALKSVLDFCKKNNKPAVLATTGYSEVDDKMIEDYARFVPIFKSSNMSEGVSVMLSLIRKALPMLEDWDIEIVEKHHHHKKDAPSGTAKMMANEVLDYRTDSNLVYGRNPESPKREKTDIGISAIRGGGCAGEHEIGFYSESEIITIKHEAFSKDIFAKGALKAGKFVVEQKPGLYTMRDIYKD